MNAIRILSEKVASKIAAGEIIDRPASVIRELMDNSIDAGAEQVFIRIERGGKSLVRVSDNGVGMSKDDLLLSIERHATSKIESETDLFSVKTLGFRGEALPSIGSVSKMEITSRPEGQLSAHRLKISGGKLAGIEEVGAPRGTTVQVKDLFFNLPARRKFLRADSTEGGHVLDALWRLSIPFPHIHFKLEEGSRTVLNLPSCKDGLYRIGSLFGGSLAESLFRVREKSPLGELEVFLAPFDWNRARADRIYVYVNRRNVRDRLLLKAIMEGYGQRLMKGRYPVAILFLELDPSMVDINIHPAKQEVKFQKSQELFRLISSTIEKGLNRPFHRTVGLEKGFERDVDRGSFKVPSVSESSPDYIGRAQQKGSLHPPASQEEFGLEWEVRVIGQLGGNYLLCETPKGLLMVDQHAAHERVLYENLKEAWKDSRVESQALLVPFTLEVDLKEESALLEKVHQLRRLGIELEPFGGRTFLLRAVPSFLAEADWTRFLGDVVSGLEHGDLDDEAVLDRVLKLMACHGALRSGHRMNQTEVAHLLRQIETAELSTHCPHGRPIFVQFTYQEIEKMFKRIV